MSYAHLKTLKEEEVTGNLAAIIKEAVSERAKFRVTSEEGSIVVLSEESFDHLMITLELLSTPGLLENLSCSDEDDHEEVQHA
ncbi:MAG: hypothetical protein K0S07_1227 [Chlamydiales bacterium]|jgi:PHD/YefM family antitoxin component YafN of YafNO toxin-antitoxin module|nr:hypothetical protein [Chlamydiales bacterium]